MQTDTFRVKAHIGNRPKINLTDFWDQPLTSPKSGRWCIGWYGRESRLTVPRRLGTRETVVSESQKGSQLVDTPMPAILFSSSSRREEAQTIGFIPTVSKSKDFPKKAVGLSIVRTLLTRCTCWMMPN